MTIQQVYPARSPGDRFDTTTPKTLVYERQGLIWENDELEKLRDLFMRNYDLDLITKILQRPPGGVLPKLEQLKLIRRCVSVNYGAYRYVYNVHIPERPVEIARRIPVPSSAMADATLPVEIESTTETKETTMSTAEILTLETKTFIAGMNAADLSDASIIKMIADIENKADHLRKIKAESTTIKALIDKHDADVLKLVKYLDERTGAKILKDSV